MFAKTLASQLRLRLPLALLFGACLLSTPVRAERFSNMKDAMNALAQDISKNMASRGVDAIAVKTFEGPAGASASSRIAQALTEQHNALDPKVDTTTAAGAWSVSGAFSVDKNENTGMAEIFIESTLKNPRGRTEASLITPIITNESETLTMFGVTGTLPTEAPAGAKNADGSTQTATEAIVAARAEATLAAIDSPQVTVDKAVVKAAPSSPYAVELLINGQPITPAIEAGVAFVDIPLGAEYEIRLINNSDLPAGVTLAIDGINSLVFSEQFKGLGKWVVLPGKPGVIKGWFFDNAPARRFKVMDYGESVAARFAATKDIGTITAVFCGAFPPGKLPENERKVIASRGQAATGLGSPVDQRVSLVNFEYGLDRAAVSIRYAKPDLSDLPPGEPNNAAPPKLAN
jgi:hypothetical protein